MGIFGSPSFFRLWVAQAVSSLGDWIGLFAVLALAARIGRSSPETSVGLVMSARVLVGATGPQHFDFVTRTGGTDYLSADFAPLNSFSNITNYIQTANPATGNPWAVSDFQAAGFNVGEETKP